MERITDVSKLVYRHGQGGQFRWVTVTTLILALGMILHLVSPNVAGVTPNWMIAAYCVAILLTKPTFKQALGIGLVAALINVITSKSAFPYGNLLSEPVGTLVCCFIVTTMGRLPAKWQKLTSVVTGFISTMASGLVFVTILFFVLHLPSAVYVKGLLPVVFIVALINAVGTPLLYVPAQRLFVKRGFLEGSVKVVNSDHSNLDLRPSKEGIVVLEHLSYQYAKQDKLAIKDVNLAVQKGDFIVITGPAGCGKSTVAMAMVGAVPKFFGGTLWGMAFVEGKATTQEDIANLATNIGIVLADYDTQLVTMTVAEEVAFAMENRGYDKDAIVARSAEIFKQVGLEGLEHREITSLSGGQRQRLAIGSVLATNPSILVLDEPTSSLDPEGTEDLYRLVGKLNKEYGITVVVVDHDLQACLPYANRLVLMEEGSIVCDDRPVNCLQFMADRGGYDEVLPSVFVASLALKAADFPVSEPWLSVEEAKSCLDYWFTDPAEEEAAIAADRAQIDEAVAQGSAQVATQVGEGQRASGEQDGAFTSEEKGGRTC